MSIVVQKFGGTSVADAQKIIAAARKAIRTQQQGKQVVMVVSAMGHNTDMLVELADQVSDNPPDREMDMLLSTGEQVSVALMAMAIENLGHKAVSLTGAQIGIKTDSTHTKARIRSISTERVKKLLDEGNIVIAAGFQGIDDEFNITTLGRGGSDTTAVALAAVLGAESCEIYTDVDGIYTTDPRLLAEARRVQRISYDEMLELASLGAGVMHSRSIEFGKKFGVPIHVRSSFSDTTGTMIVAEPESQSRPVSGAAVTKNEARITICGVPDRPGASLRIFTEIARRNIPVDMIVQNVGGEGLADVSFTVVKDDLKRTLKLAEQIAEELDARTLTHDDNIAKLSVVGLAMAHLPGVAHRMFRALSDAGVNILLITTSEIKISVAITRDQLQSALTTVHKVFSLDQEPDDVEETPSGGAGHASAVDVVERLQGMEDLLIDDVSLDESQALVTIKDVPDQPGIAARAFEEVAAQGINVDMIVQSFGHDALADLSFTIPQTDLDKCIKLAGKLSKDLGCGMVQHTPAIAKLSVSGIGMRSHAQVALRMFQALTEAKINVEMISTSEVRVNVVVAGEHGPVALRQLRAAFAEFQK